MSEQDGEESTGSRTPSRVARDEQRFADMEARQEANRVDFEQRIMELLAQALPRSVRASDVGGFATPQEGSVENDPSEDIATARAISPTAAEAAIARHTVGFVPPPLPPSGVPPPIPVGPAVAPFPTRTSRLELPIPDIDAAAVILFH